MKYNTSTQEHLYALTKELAAAAKAYYTGRGELMDNYTYDKKYDELSALEEELNFFFPESPTHYVGYAVSGKLQKIEHEFPALSLDKTKSRPALTDWLGSKDGVLSWKLDGLTCQLTYDNGKLVNAATRGNGYVGENITANAKYFSGVPKEISYSGHLVVRGEAFMEYTEFEKVNAFYGGVYENPRNLASSVVRARDEKVPASCHICFMAFELVYPKEKFWTISASLDALSQYGFEVVPHCAVTAQSLDDSVSTLETELTSGNIPFPSDGLVLTFEDVAYGQSLGVRGKSPRHSIAFKWADDTVQSTLRGIEWSCSRTGLINPVAIFDPVRLEGTTVSRASLHNLSYMKQKRLSIGSDVEVFKANKIIPAIASCNSTVFTIDIPSTCPVCGSQTEIRLNGDGTSEFLFCQNQNCGAKMVGKFERLCCRDALNVEGMSSKTIEQFCSRGWLNNYADIYHLPYDEIAQLDGFGDTSAQNIRSAVEHSRNTTLKQFIYALGIPLVGLDVAGALSSLCHGDVDTLLLMVHDYDFTSVDGIGPKIAKSIHDFWADHSNALQAESLIEELTFESHDTQSDTSLAGLTFVITGTLNHFSNRDELKQLLISKGAKVAGSVSKNTTALINNDTESASGKNQKAKELGVPILSEESLSFLILNLPKD